MTSFLLIPILTVAIGLQSNPETADALFRRLLDRIAAVGLDTPETSVWTVTEWPQVSVETTRDELPEPSSIVTYTAVLRDNGILLHTRSKTAGSEAGTSIARWDGRQWLFITPGSDSVRIFPHFATTQAWNVMGFFNHWSTPTPLGPSAGLRGGLETWSATGVRREEKHQVLAMSSADGLISADAWIDAASGDLDRLALEFRQAAPVGDQAGEPIVVGRYECDFADWSASPTGLRPSFLRSVRYPVDLAKRAGKQPLATRHELQRGATADAPADLEQMWDLQPPDGVQVFHRGLRVIFNQGDSLIRIDGMTLETVRPVRVADLSSETLRGYLVMPKAPVTREPREDGADPKQDETPRERVVTRESQKPSFRRLHGPDEIEGGRIQLAGAVTPVSRSIELTNPGDQPVVVERVVTSCGCAAAKVSSLRIEPGQVVQLDATLNLHVPGAKKEAIWIVYEDEEVQKIEFTATGVTNTDLFADRNVVDLITNTSDHFYLFALTPRAEIIPADVQIRAPEGIEATFSTWELVHPGSPIEGMSARWMTRIDLVRKMDVPRQGFVHPMSFAVDSSPSVRVYIDGSPWR